MAVQQHEKGMRLFALLEHGRVLGHADRAALGQDGVEIGSGKSGK
jgi:hypothetical protein